MSAFDLDQDLTRRHAIALGDMDGHDLAGDSACTSVSIFIASVISTAWPALTTSPSLTSTSTMLPGMVVLM